MTKLALPIISLFLSGALYASDRAIPNLSFAALMKVDQTLEGNRSNFDEVRKTLWLKYLKETQSLTQLKSEYEGRALKYGDKTMRFSLEKRGQAPNGGYPLYIALHGGGNTAHSINESQWNAMKVYYNGSVKDGIYVATRGITDNWNLHFERESYPLYEKLIESAILFDGVNPNRVYLLGFSAGGDGVYQITPRMPDRFAAANMSAGHNNGLTFDNLFNTPFILQVGEYDSAYGRNRLTAQNNILLNELAEKYHGGFLHNTFIHYGGSHNSWHDNDSYHRNQLIIADPIAWLQNGNRKQQSVNTNAIDSLNRYERVSQPAKLVWNLGVWAEARDYQTGAALLANEGSDASMLAKPKALFYWLDVSVAGSFPDKGKLVVEADKKSNSIKVLEVNNLSQFRVLLNPDLLDLTAPIKVMVKDELIATLNVRAELKTMVRTLLERSDLNEIYEGQITFTYDTVNNTWQAA